jgi:tetratricopeptide (TPR) repeat protein
VAGSAGACHFSFIMMGMGVRPGFAWTAISVVLTALCVAQERNNSAPADASAVARQAADLAESGRCAEALPRLKRSVRQLTDKDLKRRVGLDGLHCTMTLNQFDQALDFLQILGREFPHDPEVLYVSIHAYSDIATRKSQELAQGAPESPQAHELNAEALEEQGKWDQAEKEYRWILQQDRKAPGIHFRLGRLLLSKPDPGPEVAAEAKKQFQQELEIDPSNAGAEYVLGELARQSQSWDEAAAHFTRAAKLDAAFGDAFLGLGESLASAKKFSEAIPPLQTAARLEPQNPAAHYNLAIAYSRVGRKQDAEQEFAIQRRMTQGNGGAGEQPAPSVPAAPPEP